MEITIARPDDWHVHLRDGPMLGAVLPATASVFGRALVMPNLVPPVVTGADAADYRDRIMAVMPRATGFEPLMTLYLTEDTDPSDLRAAKEVGLVQAAKLYPAGATTNSDAGVRDIGRIARVLDTMAQVGLTLCVHGEVTDPDVDVFDREAVFLDRVLGPLRGRHPGLRVVLEHVTTREGLDFVREGGDGIAGTITAHHLMVDRNHLLAGRIRPHYYCLPVPKRRTHREALVEAATSGDPRFFLGTDSAPHLDRDKLSPCGCAGCFTAPVAVGCVAQVFEEAGALDRLEGFCALHGAAFHRVGPSRGTIILRRGEPAATAPLDTPEGPVTVFDPGRPLRWAVA